MHWDLIKVFLNWKQQWGEMTSHTFHHLCCSLTCGKFWSVDLDGQSDPKYVKIRVKVQKWSKQVSETNDNSWPSRRKSTTPSNILNVRSYAALEVENLSPHGANQSVTMTTIYILICIPAWIKRWQSVINMPLYTVLLNTAWYRHVQLEPHRTGQPCWFWVEENPNRRFNLLLMFHAIAPWAATLRLQLALKYALNRSCVARSACVGVLAWAVFVPLKLTLLLSASKV